MAEVRHVLENAVGRPFDSAEMSMSQLLRDSGPCVVKLSVVRTSADYLLEFGGLFTQGSRPGRTVGESVGGILEMDSSDWSNGIRHHVFDTRSDTEFKLFGPINHLRYVSDIRKLS